MSRLLNVSPWGAKTKVSVSNGVIGFEKSQDIGAVLDENVANQNDGIHRGEEGDFWHVARIPLIVLEGWLKEYNKEGGRLLFSPFADDEHWNRFVFARLNSSDWRKLRTSLCRI